jgi:carbonic anhydrase/acetyltransferase-like protein (isoleucine patch superfamily)
MGSTLLDGVVMEPGSVVAAGAVVPPGAFSACRAWGLSGGWDAWGGLGACSGCDMRVCINNLADQPTDQPNRIPPADQLRPTPNHGPTPGTIVKTGQIFAGAPAKLLRALTAEEAAFLKQSADNYVGLAREHK